MTNAELDRWIAEKVMGWRLAVDNTDTSFPHIDSILEIGRTNPVLLVNSMILILGTCPYERGSIWTPTTNIAQAMEAEGKIPEELKWKYIKCLMQSCGIPDLEYFSGLFDLIHATPKQRCNAIYEAKGESHG